MDRQSALSTLRAAVSTFGLRYTAAADRWCVALSGGPDSLALTAVAAKVRPTTALIVDHRLQADSDRVAATAAEHARALGCVDAQVLCVDVGSTGGPEAAARTARYRALDAARADAPVLLAHTLDDQAETVLLGLGRGSGPRSIAGMRPHDPPWCRPLLGVRRTVTHQACDELGIEPWQDPHNADPRYTRARLRAEVLPLLEEVLGGGVAEALARTATALREDTETLDDLARWALAGASVGDGLDTGRLSMLPEAVRRRVIRSWLLAGGAVGLTDKQIRCIDTLVTDWRGQGGVAVGSALRSERLFAGRREGMLTLYREPVGGR
ncbi:tRNA lysidine(34) synthetase TilS [Mycolicibacterium moriokaense]|nr:tRNA lysidine(34) synthetase TilS [Mycolicibacterium moriokaense]